MPGGLRVTRLVRIATERIEHDGVGAEQMQLREVIDDLVDCSLTGEAPAGGDGFFGQPQGDTRHKAGDRSLVFVREHRYPVHRLTQPGHRDPKRMPAIAQAHRAAHARIAVAAHPYRYPPTAVVFVVLPGRAQCPQVVVGQLPALPERDAECVELLDRPADAHPEDQASPADFVEIGGHPGGQQRVPVRHDQDRRPEPDRAGDAGEPGQRGERFVERHRILLGDVRGHHDVVGDHQQIKAEALHRLGPAAQQARCGTRSEIRHVHAELHRARLPGDHPEGADACLDVAAPPARPAAGHGDPRTGGGSAYRGRARVPGTGPRTGDGPGPGALGNVFQECPPAGYGGAVVWPEDPGSLLTGPRGRRMCWSLVESVGRPARPPIGPAWEQVQLGSRGADSAELAAELGTAVAWADLDAVAAMSDVALLAAVAEDERSAALRPSDPAAPYSGHWWSSPKWSGVASTTRALPDLGAVQLAAMEDSPGQDEMRCWPVKPRQVPRIYEIAEPDHWIALAARYPLDVSKSRRHDWWKITGWPGRWLMPDYAAAAADYDAIHLTVGGYLTTAGEALPVNDARCLLAAWDPDETYWLTDILAPAGPPARWVRDGSTQVDWRLAPF